MKGMIKLGCGHSVRMIEDLRCNTTFVGNNVRTRALRLLAGGMITRLSVPGIVSLKLFPVQMSGTEPYPVPRKECLLDKPAATTTPV